MNETISNICKILSSSRLTINDEKKLQSEIKDVLEKHYPYIESEKRLDNKNIIDFFIEGIGIEVKIKGRKKSIYNQCVRYCEFEQIKAIILVTSLFTGFPGEINNKPCYIVKLSQAWL